MAIGMVSGSANGDLWGKYMSQPRIIMLLQTGEYSSGWRSIKGGLD
ncbi:hypothetical protein [Frisingicoccus sp.]